MDLSWHLVGVLGALQAASQQHRAVHPGGGWYVLAPHVSPGNASFL